MVDEGPVFAIIATPGRTRVRYSLANASVADVMEFEFYSDIDRQLPE